MSYEFDVDEARQALSYAESMAAAGLLGRPQVFLPGIVCHTGHHVSAARSIEEAILVAQTLNRKQDECQYRPIPIFLDVGIVNARAEAQRDPLYDLKQLPEAPEHDYPRKEDEPT